MRRWGGLALLLTLAAPSAAREIEVPDGEMIPEIRPCVDMIVRGSLVSTGEPVMIDDPDDILGHAIYSYRFKPSKTLAGEQIRKPVVLKRAGHALRDVDVGDSVTVLARTDDGGTRLVDWNWVWRDERGRAFIPVWNWPANEYRNSDWRPANVANFAKPVTYAPGQPIWDDAELTEDDAEPGLIEKRNGRYVILYGLYLDDIPKIIAAANSEDCWR